MAPWELRKRPMRKRRSHHSSLALSSSFSSSALSSSSPSSARRRRRHQQVIRAGALGCLNPLSFAIRLFITGTPTRDSVQRLTVKYDGQSRKTASQGSQRRSCRVASVLSAELLASSREALSACLRILLTHMCTKPRPCRCPLTRPQLYDEFAVLRLGFLSTYPWRDDIPSINLL